ncbi:hypothetical protein [Aeromicrobium sp. 179-A 4D2 NHS]|uniref:hypothetical protein n=1 Tax=Aeromicrobium sp. 179-A 4D2 NHS TaxID=3142375 RepID=UPI0039A2AA68
MTATLDFVTTDETTNRRDYAAGGNTVYQRLLALGHTREDIDAAAAEGERKRANRKIYLTVNKQNGTDEPVIGVTYTGDYRAEEEWGLAAISEKFNGSTVNQSDIVSVVTYGAHPYFVIEAKKAWDFLDTLADRVDTAASRAISEAEWYDGYFRDYRKSVADLRAELKGIVTPLPRKRADLLTALRVHVHGLPERVSVGEFHRGDFLVMAPADRLLTDALALLFEATETNNLRFGGSSNPFSRAVSFFDDRDLTPETVESIRASQHYNDTQMNFIADVKDQLEAKGRLYAMSPGRLAPGDRPMGDYWFINYYPTVNKAADTRYGVSGWMSRDELLHGLATDWADFMRDR